MPCPLIVVKDLVLNYNDENLRRYQYRNDVEILIDLLKVFGLRHREHY